MDRAWRSADRIPGPRRIKIGSKGRYGFHASLPGGASSDRTTASFGAALISQRGCDDRRTLPEENSMNGELLPHERSGSGRFHPAVFRTILGLAALFVLSSWSFAGNGV